MHSSPALPKTHIVLAGIDKMLPSLNDLDLFLPLLSAYHTDRISLPITVSLQVRVSQMS